MENADESVRACVRVCLPFTTMCACVVVGGTSMSALERQNALSVHLCVYMLCAQLKNPFQKAVSLALVFTMSL